MSGGLRRRPQVANLEAFLDGTDDDRKPHQVRPPVTRRDSSSLMTHPWQEPGVRLDLIKVFNLRLPEPELLKLRYIAENSPKSMHAFCMEAVKTAIDQEIARLLEKK